MQVDDQRAAAEPWESAYRIFIADADGHLKVLRTLPAPPAPAPAPPTAPPKKDADAAAAAATETTAETDDAAEQAEGAAHDDEEEEEEAPTLPCLQIVPIEGRPKIPSPSFSSTSVNSSPHAVQKMAGGWLASGHWVLAIARKDASIDVVLPLPQPQPQPQPQSQPRRADREGEGEEWAPQKAFLIATLTEDNMRAGMERWVGLSVGSSGIYSCTSAGALRFTPVVRMKEPGEILTVTNLTAGEATVVKLRNAPLTHVVFTTLPRTASASASNTNNSDPTHFLCGGHDVPLSIWHLPSAFASTIAHGPLAISPAARDASSAVQKVVPADGAGEGEDALSGKQKKRKRQIEARNKAKELREGEVWRAKNLPNDALSLQQKPNISAITILSPGTAGPTPTSSNDDDDDIPPLPTGLQIGTATKNGLLRIYQPEPGSAQGKAVAEFACIGGKGVEGKKKEAQGVKGTMAIGLIKKGVASGGAEVKLVEPGGKESELLVADTQGKLYVLDWKTRRVLYQYPNIDGAITSLLTLPSPPTAAKATSKPSSSSPAAAALIFSTSLDRILRLHSTSEKEAALLHGKANVGRGRGKTLISVFAGAMFDVEPELEGTLPAAPVAAVWDGVVPLALPGSTDGSVGEKKMGVDGDEEEEDEDEEDEEDDVWDEMDQVGDGKTGGGEEEEDVGRARVVKKKRLAA
ncbi:unnamed protein product [Tilletia controversa]|nr:unnamed protein product [Tilletia controversa]CAD6948102.1 unnamed protein product [Tilletia controversa]